MVIHSIRVEQTTEQREGGPSGRTAKAFFRGDFGQSMAAGTCD
jgi:hypothetical protein